MNPATERARELVATLAGAGVRHVVLCPGSRSTPLAYAFYDLSRRRGIELFVRHDERVAGFTALGIGRAIRAPAAVVTTSGTAVANLHPAVLEAHHAAVPLLVLAADRPPRLRGTWANQTSDLQAEMFGAATRLTADLRPDQPVAEWGAAARAAVAAARGRGGGRRGPVLLNLGFDDPLLPDDPEPWQPQPDDARLWTAPPDPPEVRPPSTESADALVEATLARRTVVVAGDGAGPDARRYADAWGLPLLAEPTSGSRGGPNLVAAYRLLLDEPALGGRVEHVVAFGRPTLSRPVTRLLGRPDVGVHLVQRHPADPAPERTDVERVSPAQLAKAMAASYDRKPVDRDWPDAWHAAGSVAARAVDQVLDGWPVLTGPLVAREVAGLTRLGTHLMLAASNPVRDMDLAGPGWPETLDVVANRGVSGIDGTVSTATGLALGGVQPVCVLVGDVALLHDLGSLVLGPDERRPDLTVVVVNDSGGGIFSLLEPGAAAERDRGSAARFERVFGTPHTVDLAQVCAGLDVPHALVASAAGLRERLARPARGLSVIEVRVERADLRPLHDAIGRAVRAAVAGLDLRPG